MVAYQLQQSKPNDSCCVAVLPGLRNSAGTVAASPCIIQCQAPLDLCILVIPSVGLSLWSPWQLFPLPLASLGPSLAHMRLSCSSPNTVINSCGVTVFRCLGPSVLFLSKMNVFMAPLASAGCIAAFHDFLQFGLCHLCHLDQSACGCWLRASAFAPVVCQLHSCTFCSFCWKRARRGVVEAPWQEHSPIGSSLSD